jgi:hypothetical protein
VFDAQVGSLSRQDWNNVTSFAHEAGVKLAPLRYGEALPLVSC